MADATAAARLASNEGAHAYVCSTAVPSSIVDVARPAIAMATSGSPKTALAYQRLVKPSASARSACCTIRSMVVPPPGNPMRMERTFPPRLAGLSNCWTRHAFRSNIDGTSVRAA